MILIHDLGESYVGDIIPIHENYEEYKDKERRFCEEVFLQGTHAGVADLSEYFYLWELWCENESDYNVKIAKELDKIQMLYKLMVLLKERTIILTKKRVKDF